MARSSGNSNTVNILLINNDGGGFADNIEVKSGTTIAAFFSEKFVGKRPENYNIRVNRLPCTQQDVLKDGDRLSITPTKVQGA